jgi:simple sugar transport system permease protein
MKRNLALDAHLVVLLVALVTVGGMLSLAQPSVFLSVQNLQSMLLQSSVIGLLSLGVGITLLTGGIDLSVTAISNLASILIALFLSSVVADGGLLAGPFGITLALALGVSIGIACGLFNGFLIAVLGYSPILATLGTATLFLGIGTVITGGTTLFGVSSFASIGRGTFLGVPIPALVFLAAAIVLWLVLTRRRFGFNVYLFGANEAAARYSGINARRLILGVYAISGALAGVAGMINLGVTNSANVDFGTSYVLLAILVSVLGGISPLGGSGNVLGIVVAVLILQFLSTGLNLLFQSSGSNFLRDFAWGLTLIIVLALAKVRYGSATELFKRRPDRNAP